MSTSPIAAPSQILLAIDGSEHAFAAAAFVGDLALSSECQMNVLAVLIPREASRHAALVGALDQVSTGLISKGFNVNAELITGYPSETLLEWTALRKPDLVALGAQGLRATLGILLGGVVQQQVEYADAPVLVVRAPHTGIKRVLMVTDGSAHSHRALAYMATMGLPADIRLEVLHVLPPVPTPDLVARTWPLGGELAPPMPSQEIEAAVSQQVREEEAWGYQLLEKAVNYLAVHGLEAQGALKRGDAASVIIDYIKANQIDFVVAGSRGLSRVRGWLLGSVSRKLVHYSGCSVLIVKGDQPE